MKRTILSLILLICACLALQAIDRGMGNPKSVYIQKGTVAANLTFGYNRWKATGEDDETGVVLAGLITIWKDKIREAEERYAELTKGEDNDNP